MDSQSKVLSRVRFPQPILCPCFITSRKLTSDAAIAASKKVTKSEGAATKSFAAKGVTYKDGKVTVRTDRPQVTRDDQIASAQAAVARTKDQLRSRPDAFYRSDDS